MKVTTIVNLTVASSILATVFFCTQTIAKDTTAIRQGGIDVRTGAASKEVQTKSNISNKGKLAPRISDKEILRFYIKSANKKVLSSIKSIASDFIEYGSRTLVTIPAKNIKNIPSRIKSYIKPEPNLNKIFLQHIIIDPSTSSKLDIKQHTEKTNAPTLFLIHFKGPIKTNWKKSISGNNLTISSYLGKNTLLVWAKNEDIARFKKDATMKFVQWIGDYKPEYKLQPRIKSLKTNIIDITVKLFRHSSYQKTEKRIVRLLEKTPYTAWESGKYRYVRSKFPKEAIKWLTLQNDIISITLNQKEALSSERQGIISVDNISSNAPVSPTTATIGIPYLSWLTGKFPSAGTQFDTFMIDITDSGFDRGELTFGLIHPDLTDGLTSRVLYQRRVTGATSTNTMPSQNVDHNGHGTFAASVAAGLNTSATGGARDLQQVDTSDFHFGVGIAPHAQLGSTKLFYWNGSKTTSISPLPNFYDLYSKAFIDPDADPMTDNNILTTIFNNSWGDQYLDGVTTAPNGDLQWADWGQYDTNSRDYDQLVRDADTTSAAPNNQQAVIIFSSGNTGWKFDPDQDGNTSDLGYIPRNDPPVGGSAVQKSSLWNKGATSKNTIVVGASENVGVPKQGDTNCSQRDVSNSFADNVYDTAYFSSRGPTLDGRFKPDLVAPGVRINAAQSTMIEAALNSSTCDFPSNGSTLYMRNMGTSFAAPAVAGAAALLQQWFINNKTDAATSSTHYHLEDDVKQTNSNPSPSMTKAWLMNSTTYLSRPGAETDDPIDNNDAMTSIHDDLPSNVQGMGLLNIKRALDSIPRIYRDQTHLFNGDLADPVTTTSSDYIIRGKVALDDDPSTVAVDDVSFRVTLVWTDYPGDENTVFGAASRLKNDLNLSVCLGTTNIDCSGGTLYNGNNYTQDASQPAGTVDSINNVESVWIPEASAAAGTDFVIRVSPATVDFGAVSLNDAVNEQDFSLVIYNAKIPALDESFPNATVATVTDDGSTTNITTALLENEKFEFVDDGSTSDVGNGLYISEAPDTSGITDPRVHVNFVAGADPTLNTITFNIDDNVAGGEVLPAQTFIYTVSDGYGATNTATATLNVTGSDDAPTGAPSIIGAATENVNLTVDISTIMDDDGLGSFTFEWFRDGVSIVTAPNYILDDIDVGTMITVTANYTDGGGNMESILSAAIGPVTNINDLPTSADTFINIPEGVGTSHTFDSSEFPYPFDAEGDPLNQIRITGITGITIPAGSTLQLSGVDVSNTDVISVAQISNLVFTPAAGATQVNNYASFVFEVHDGTDFSTPANTMAIHIIPGAAHDPLDVVIVADTSGSMNGTSPGSGSPITKMELLKLSVNNFIDQWSLLSVPDDRIGLVLFSSSPEPYLGLGSLMVDGNNANMQAIGDHVCDVNLMNADPCDRTGGGATAMGGGIQEAINALRVTDPGTNNNQNIIVFTDGMQNIAPLVVQGAPDAVTGDEYEIAGDPNKLGAYNDNAAPKTLRIHTIGTGVINTSSWQTLLAGIASDTSINPMNQAFHAFHNDASSDLPSDWIDSLITALNTNTLQKIAHEQGSRTKEGSVISHSFSLNSTAEHVNFSVMWTGVQEKDAMSFILRKGKKKITVTPANNNVQIIRKDSHTIASAIFPVKADDGSMLSAAGDWYIDIKTNSKISLDYNMWVIADDSGIKYEFIPPSSLLTVGDRFPIQIRLLSNKKPVTRNVTASVLIESPRIGEGTFLSINRADRKKLEEFKVPHRPNLKLAAKKGHFLLRDKKLANTYITPVKSTIQLFDDGDLKEHGDKKAGDGIFSALSPANTIPGKYRLDIRIKGSAEKNGTVSRVFNASSLVMLKDICRKKSIFTITAIKHPKATHKVQVTPIDCYDNYIGPGYARDIKTKIPKGVLVNSIIDNLDGSYTALIKTQLFSKTNITIKVRNVEFSQSISARIPWWWGGIIIFILVIFVTIIIRSKGKLTS